MKKEIVIIGGGFAGVNLARKLRNEENIHITLVDRNNYNFFPPLLYQVATGFLEVSNISYPFRKLFHHQKNANFRMGELIQIIPSENKILLSTGELSYDYLILATGTESNYFGIENIQRNSLPMKTVNDAIELRNFILLKAEEAILTKDPIERKKLTSIVIAGGGPTGVEIAGMLAEMKQNIFDKDYPELRSDSFSIYLVDGAESLLTPMSVQSQEYTLSTLLQLGVDVKLNKRVKDYINDQVIFDDGEIIDTKILIWAAGVISSVFDGIPKECYGPGRRLLVDQYNKVYGTANIYAIGDTALLLSDPNFPKGHPQMAQVAIQQAINLAGNIKAHLKNQEQTSFSYHDKGSMAIIGRSKAAADLPKPRMHFTGWLAWAMWLFVHLFSLISYRNRLKTMVNWTTSYFTKDQTLRMIIRPDIHSKTK